MKEDLKYGEKYRLELLCKSQTGNIIVFETPTGGLLPLGVNDLECVSPITPSEPPTSVGTAPKYDPCRRFRKGDEVEYHPKDGRELFEAKRLLAQTLTVVENEHEEYNRVAVKAQNGDVLSVPFYYLKLVTPVEKLEPYIMVELCNGGYAVYEDSEKEDNEVCIFWNDAHPHAKESAEAERDRLNAEHRKENSHE